MLSMHIKIVRIIHLTKEAINITYVVVEFVLHQ